MQMRNTSPPGGTCDDNLAETRFSSFGVEIDQVPPVGLYVDLSPPGGTCVENTGNTRFGSFGVEIDQVPPVGL